MQWENVSFDWNQARAFLVSAESGSFSAGARALGLTQSTLSRQVAGLEGTLGVLLFERAGRSLRLTEPGRDLLDQFRAMGAAALQISLGASGHSREISGRVSIAATDTVSAHWLPEAIRRIGEQAPGIQIDLVVSDRLVDLGKREADIAVRHTRPCEGHLVAKLLRETIACLYASSTYLDRVGRPMEADDLRAASFVGYAPVERFRSGFDSRGIPLDPSQFKVVTDSGIIMCELIMQGFGIGVITREIGDKLPGVERVLPDLGPIPFPVWLTTHRELYTSRRIRLVFDILAEAL